MKIELNEHTSRIFGMMCFEAATYCPALRRSGLEVAHKAEDEQAAVIHWLINLYLGHGEQWEAAANHFLKTWAKAASESRSPQAESIP